MTPGIEEGFLRRLANLRFIVNGRRRGRLSGAHSSPRAGVSLEFADYRAYTPGDDFRAIDWNVVGRLDRVLVKTYVHETAVPIRLLVDLSASMALGNPPKGQYAIQLAASLAYLGLRGLDRVGVFPHADRLLPSVPARHGMGQMGRILRLLSGIEPAGATSFHRTVAEYLLQTREGGVTVLISDFLTDEDLGPVLARLAHRRDEVVLLRVFDPADLRPQLRGATRLVDVESSRAVTLNVGQATLRAYEQRIDRNRHGLRELAVEQGIPYVEATTDLPIERFLHEKLRRAGVLQ